MELNICWEHWEVQWFPLQCCSMMNSTIHAIIRITTLYSFVHETQHGIDKIHDCSRNTAVLGRVYNVRIVCIRVCEVLPLCLSLSLCTLDKSDCRCRDWKANIWRENEMIIPTLQTHPHLLLFQLTVVYPLQAVPVLGAQYLEVPPPTWLQEKWQRGVLLKLLVHCWISLLPAQGVFSKPIRIRHLCIRFQSIFPLDSAQTQQILIRLFRSICLVWTERKFSKWD